MLICIGEILVDLIGESDKSGESFKRYAGGAPFNVACAAKNMGGVVGFVGNVGDDIFGRFLCDFAQSRHLDYTDISVDKEHNTTLAVVRIDPFGEREFCFIRKNAADYHIIRSRAEKAIEKADTVCMGTLMISEACGYRLAEHISEFAKAKGKKLCIDVNYRDDIYSGRDPVPTYKKFIELADIVKLSEDEINIFANGDSLEEKIFDIGADQLVCVTLGKNGCAYALNGKVRRVRSISIDPVDTTGAGDAFFGCLLSQLDGKNLQDISEQTLDEIFYRANVCGALTATARGAIDALPCREAVFTK